MRWFTSYVEYGKGEFHITDHAILLAKTNHTIKNSEKYRTKCLKNFITITEHLKHIFESGELQADVVCRKFRHTTQHGAIEGKTQTKEVTFYNLDAIISVGYRVKSLQGTQFRIWATQRLKEYRALV